MIAKRFVVIGLSLVLVLVGILVACAGPTPSPTSTPTATPTPTVTPSGSLAQIIAGAKTEGTVSLKLRQGFTPKSMDRLAKEIKETFGVDLTIKFNPTGSFPNDLAQAIMEYQAGATPSFDLITLSDHVVSANKAGVMEKVDWKPLLTGDSNPEVVPQHPAFAGAIIYYTGYLGLIYNPEKVSASEIPLTLSQLADPKWKGKIGIHNYANSWARQSFIMGKEKTVSDLRAILKNGAVNGVYATIYNRYLLGEVWLTYMTTAYLKQAWDTGMPATYQSLDFADAREYCLVLLKGAPHPNAAKLVAIYLASPAGAKFTLEESGTGNLYYPGNFEHDLRLQNQKQGIPESFYSTYPGLLEFSLTDEFTQWQNEIDIILKTGG